MWWASTAVTEIKIKWDYHKLRTGRSEPNSVLWLYLIWERKRYVQLIKGYVNFQIPLHVFGKGKERSRERTN